MCPFHLLADVAAWLRRRFRGKVSLLDRDESLVVADRFKANTWRYGFLAVGTLVAGAIGIPVLNYVSAPGILSTEAMRFVKERMESLEFPLLSPFFSSSNCWSYPVSGAGSSAPPALLLQSFASPSLSGAGRV